MGGRPHGLGADSNDLIAVLSCKRGPTNEDTPFEREERGYAAIHGGMFIGWPIDSVVPDIVLPTTKRSSVTCAFPF
jgi:hypothetical protein